jgi:hypothetical protein
LAFVALEFSGVRHAPDRAVRSELPASGKVVASPVASNPAVKDLAPLPPAMATLAAPHWAIADPRRPAPGGSTDGQRAEPEGEVCGLGNAPSGSAEAASLSKVAEVRDADAAARLFALMAQSPDVATRAAAQLGSDQRASLAMAAQQTRDPVVYAFAQQACSRPGTQPAACALLSPYRMASLDPLNVVPWLWVAEEASRVGNDQSVVEAVYRASLAKESRLREYAFTSLALSAIPANWPTWDAVFASAHVLQIHAALRLPSYLPMVKYCSAEHARDVNVRQTCDRLAQVLVERGDTLVDHGIGRRLGERAGWPTDKVELLDARHAAYKRLALDGDTLASGSGHGSCGQLVRNVQLALAHARDGELLYAKARLAESGTTDSETLLQYRKGQAASSPR